MQKKKRSISAIFPLFSQCLRTPAVNKHCPFIFIAREGEIC
jgi:hypothetical protein